MKKLVNYGLIDIDVDVIKSPIKEKFGEVVMEI